ARPFIGQLSKGYEESCTKDRCNRHLSRTGYSHLINDFRRILRSASGARINPAGGENIGGLTSLIIQCYCKHGPINAPFLCKIRDLKKVIVGDCDHQRRTRNDAAFEFPGKDKACGKQQNTSNQKSLKEDFHSLR